MATIDDLLSKWMDESKSIFISNYNRLGLKASGKTEKETVVKKIEQNHQQILTTPYVGALVHGRRPTTSKSSSGQTLQSKIRTWIDDKGIQPEGNITKNSLAFLIARRIHNEGIKVPNQYNPGTLISDTFTQQRINSLFSDIGKLFITDVKTDIQKTWQQ